MVPTSFTPRYLSKGVLKCFPTDIYSIFIYNCPISQSTKIPSLSEWINKPLHKGNGIQFSTNDSKLSSHKINGRTLHDYCEMKENNLKWLHTAQ